MKIYNLYPDSTQWYCQWKHDSIFFALINSGALSPFSFSWWNPNNNMEEKTLEEKILFELKVITVWGLITESYPFNHKGIFHDIYTAFMRLTENKAKMDENIYRKKVLFYEKKIGELYDFYADYVDKSLSGGTLDAENNISLKAEEFTTLDDLPCKSLICMENNHWVVYLKTDGDCVETLDSRIWDSCGRVPVSALCGKRIIKPKDIKINDRRVRNLLSEMSQNPYDILEILSRREFSQKITECIGRLDQISFTEHDYNRFVGQAKSCLEKLDKEHYKYTCL